MFNYNQLREGFKEWWEITPEELGPDEEWPKDRIGRTLCDAAIQKKFWSWNDGDFKTGWVRCGQHITDGRFCHAHSVCLSDTSETKSARYDGGLESELDRLDAESSRRLSDIETVAQYGSECVRSWDSESDVSTAIKEYRSEQSYLSDVRLFSRQDIKQWPWGYRHTNPKRRLRRVMYEGLSKQA